MIRRSGERPVVIGYGEFVRLPESDDADPHKGCWLAVAIAFLTDHRAPDRFRHMRIRRLLVHLVELIAALDASRLSEPHREVRAALARMIGHCDDD